MKRYLMAVGLVVCLFLSSCTDREEAAVQQRSRLSEAAELEEEHVLLTIDEREIPAWRYLYWLGMPVSGWKIGIGNPSCR